MKRVGMLAGLLVLVLSSAVTTAMGADPVPFSEAVPVVDADGDEVYCVFDIERDGDIVVALRWTDCPPDTSQPGATQATILSVDQWATRLRRSERRLLELVDSKVNRNKRKSFRKYMRAIIKWTEDQQTWASKHTLEPCVEGQQDEVAAAAKDAERVMTKVLKAYNANDVAAADRLMPNVEDALNEIGSTLASLSDTTNELNCSSDGPPVTAGNPEVGAGEVGARGLGAKERDDIRVFIEEVRWPIDTSDMFFQPDPGMVSVGILVSYEALEGEPFVGSANWTASDRDGWAYPSSLLLGHPEPDLRAQKLRAGAKTRGWVFFEVPAGTDWLRLVEEGNTFRNDTLLAWEVER